MIDLIVAILVVAAFGALAFHFRHSAKDAFHREFEAWRLSASAGTLRGVDLRVVKFVYQELGGDAGSRGARTGWWFCVAPGSRWLLVIGQDTPVGMVRHEVTWVVRELSEERMRGALAGDKTATALAFGSAVEG